MPQIYTEDMIASSSYLRQLSTLAQTDSLDKVHCHHLTRSGIGDFEDSVRRAIEVADRFNRSLVDLTSG